MHGSPKEYHARNSPHAVWVSEPSGMRALQLRRDIEDYSAFFEWGRNSAGTLQLALAILADATGDSDFAKSYCIRLAREFLAGAPQERWTLSGDKIAEWCKCRKLVRV